MNAEKKARPTIVELQKTLANIPEGIDPEMVPPLLGGLLIVVTGDIENALVYACQLIMDMADMAGK